jgi:hypothetical protein
MWPPDKIDRVTKDFEAAVWVYGVSAVVEMLSEPL